MSVKKESLGGLVKILSGYAFDSSLFGDSDGMQLIRIRDVKRGYSNTFYAGAFSENFIVRKGDILIGMDGEFNLARWVGDDALLNQRVCKIEAKDGKLSEEFLCHFLPLELKKIEAKTSFATVKHLSVRDINGIQIQLPPLPTQQRIANILDKADALRKKDIQLLQHYDALAQSLFIDMFGDPVKNEMGWELRTMENVCNKITDGTHQSPHFVESGIPFLFVSNIVDNQIDYSTKKYINESEFEILNKRTPIEIGNILLTTVGSYGNPAIIESNRKFAFQRHIAFLKPNHKKINFRFLYSSLKSDFVQRQIDKKVKGVAQKTLNLVELKKLNTIYPPIELQNQFAIQIQNIEQQKEKVKAQMQASEQLFQALLQKAFSQS